MVYVEVTAKAGEGEHAEACDAIGTQNLLKCNLAHWHVNSSLSTSQSCPLIMPIPCRSPGSDDCAAVRAQQSIGLLARQYLQAHHSAMRCCCHALNIGTSTGKLHPVNALQHYSLTRQHVGGTNRVTPMLHDSMMAALTSAEKLLFGQPNLRGGRFCRWPWVADQLDICLHAGLRGVLRQCRHEPVFALLVQPQPAHYGAKGWWRFTGCDCRARASWTTVIHFAWSKI
jgi:hypothetical protein